MKCNSSHRKWAWCFLLIITGLITFYDWHSQKLPTSQHIVRNKPGEGDREIHLQVAPKHSPRNKESVSLSVREKELSSKETADCLKKNQKWLEKTMLGDNPSYDKVSLPLVFPRYGIKGPVSISWETNLPELLDDRGRIYEEHLTQEEQMVMVRATLKCNGQEQIYERPICVVERKSTASEKIALGAKKKWIKEERETRRKNEVALPTTWKDTALTWYQQQKNRGPIVFLVGVILILFPGIKEKEHKKRQEKTMKASLLKVYPELVSAMALMTGAGLSIDQIFSILVYEEKKKQKTLPLAYEAMEKTLREMKSGLSKSVCYERFGKRCHLQIYQKLGSILASRQKKGAAGLEKELEQLSYVAHKDRVRRAKKQGEEAGTKLVIPLTMLLFVVMLLVVVPPLVKMQWTY